MFKLLVAFVALAAFQGVCGVPVPEQSVEVDTVPYLDFLSSLLGSSPIAGYPFNKRQNDADINAMLQSLGILQPLSQLGTLLKRDTASPTFEFPDVGGYVSSYFNGAGASDGQNHGVLLKRLIENIANDNWESSDMLQERQLSSIFGGVPLPPHAVTQIQQAIARLRQSKIPQASAAPASK